MFELKTKFVLIGAAGYIAPRHMKAVKEIGGEIIAAYDPHDSVGILDKYFPDCAFFTEFERFDRHCHKRRYGIGYVIICSPNYLHDSHVLWALRMDCNVICEKPLCLKSSNLNRIILAERESKRKVNVILQLRYALGYIKVPKIYNIIEVKYHTPRGKWYHYSWKGDEEKSGGIITNIGIHLFDFILWKFGDFATNLKIYESDKETVKGSFDTFFSKVLFDLSISNKNEPLRSFKINSSEVQPKLFTELHTECYQEIIAERGFGAKDIKNATILCEQLRKLTK